MKQPEEIDLRTIIAGITMVAMIAKGETTEGRIADSAVRVADSLLAALQKDKVREPTPDEAAKLFIYDCRCSGLSAEGVKQRFAKLVDNWTAGDAP